MSLTVEYLEKFPKFSATTTLSVQNYNNLVKLIQILSMEKLPYDEGMFQNG